MLEISYLNEGIARAKAMIGKSAYENTITNLTIIIKNLKKKIGDDTELSKLLMIAFKPKDESSEYQSEYLATMSYFKSIIKDLEKIGIPYDIHTIEYSTNYERGEHLGLQKSIEVSNLIDDAAYDKMTASVILGLPIPQDLNTAYQKDMGWDRDFINSISPIMYYQDIDRIFHSDPFAICTFDEGIGCTAEAAIDLIAAYFDTKNLFRAEDYGYITATVIGRSKSIGMPIASTLAYMGARVKVCSSVTSKKELEDSCRKSNLIVSAVGKPGIVNQDMISKDTLVIDIGVGIDANGNYSGDVDWSTIPSETFRERNNIFITPFKYGMGTLTRMTLISRLVSRICTMRGINVSELIEPPKNPVAYL